MKDFKNVYVVYNVYEGILFWQYSIL